MQTVWSVIVVPLALLLTAVMSTISVLGSPFPGGRRWQQVCARLWARWLLGLAGIRVRARGLERIDPCQPYVFVANHQSYSDIWALFAALPREFCFVAKASLFRWPFIGWHLRRSGTISIDRGGMKETYRALLAAGETIRGGQSVVIFPEGTRSVTGEIGPFKRGSLLVAVKAGVPIVPVTITGSRRCLPKGSCLMRPGTIEVIFSDPIPWGSNGQAGRGLNEAARAAILANYAER